MIGQYIIPIVLMQILFYKFKNLYFKTLLRVDFKQSMMYVVWADCFESVYQK